jgi:hypothetical protein
MKTVTYPLKIMWEHCVNNRPSLGASILFRTGLSDGRSLFCQNIYCTEIWELQGKILVCELFGEYIDGCHPSVLFAVLQKKSV